MNHSTNNNQSGFAHLGLIAIIIAVLGAVGFVGFRVVKKQDKNQSSTNSIVDNRLKDCKGTGPVAMTHMPMDMKDVQTVIPIGALAGAHVTPIDHLYFYPTDMQNRDAAPVYAMADGTIISYQERTQSVDTGKAQKGEYRIEIQHNCDIVSYFDLLTSLDESVKSQLREGSGQNIPVKAGQEIGRVGAQSLDTAIYNYGMKLEGFVNPKSYEAEPWKIHTDDFFKYFNEDQRSQMLAKNLRKAEPRAGKIDYDIAGKLIGNWFEVGTNGYAGPKESQNGRNSGDGRGYWSGHFSIAPDVIDPTITNLSFGNYQGQAKQFSAKDGSKDPANISKSDGIVTYELVNFTNPSPSPTGGVMMRDPSVQGVALLEVLDNNQMKLEVFPGKTATQVNGFTNAAKTYER